MVNERFKTMAQTQGFPTQLNQIVVHATAMECTGATNKATREVVKTIAGGNKMRERALRHELATCVVQATARCILHERRRVLAATQPSHLASTQVAVFSDSDGDDDDNASVSSSEARFKVELTKQQQQQQQNPSCRAGDVARTGLPVEQ